MNVLLVVLKMTVGIFSNSILLILDGVNNLGDALSSIITIVGTRLSQRKPDKEHPFGYGRLEYFTSFIIGVIVLLAGIASAKEAISKIIHPAETNYSLLTIILIAVAVAIKLLVGFYVKFTGKKINTKTLIDSGTDALLDAAVSFTTLVAIILNIMIGWKLEGVLGLLISLLVLKSAVEIMKDTVSTLLGGRGDKELVSKLYNKISSMEDVNGAYDLILHNYGPSNLIGTVHIEVSDNLPVKRIHEISRQIQAEVFMEYGIIMTVGIYASNNSDEFSVELRKCITENILVMEFINGFHGLYVDKEHRIINFDVVVDFNAKNPETLCDSVQNKMKELYPDYEFYIQSDYSYNLYK